MATLFANPSTKPRERDYKLSDGGSLYLPVAPSARSFGVSIIAILNGIARLHLAPGPRSASTVRAFATTTHGACQDFTNR
jgi:hypothetical protein